LHLGLTEAGHGDEGADLVGGFAGRCLLYEGIGDTIRNFVDGRDPVETAAKKFMRRVSCWQALGLRSFFAERDRLSRVRSPPPARRFREAGRAVFRTTSETMMADLEENAI